MRASHDPGGKPIRAIVFLILASSGSQVLSKSHFGRQLLLSRHSFCFHHMPSFCRWSSSLPVVHRQQEKRQVTLITWHYRLERHALLSLLPEQNRGWRGVRRRGLLRGSDFCYLCENISLNHRVCSTSNQGRAPSDAPGRFLHPQCGWTSLRKGVT